MNILNREFCWHEWSAWSKLIPAYDGIQQYRNCLKCNKIIRRRACCSNHANLNLWNTGKEPAIKEES